MGWKSRIEAALAILEGRMGFWTEVAESVSKSDLDHHDCLVEIDAYAVVIKDLRKLRSQVARENW